MIGSPSCEETKEGQEFSIKMLLKDEAQKINPLVKKIAYGVGVLLLFTLLFVVLRYLVPIYNPTAEGVIQCDAENVQGKTFVTGRYLFSNAITKSNEKAFRGTFSSKTTPSQKRGFLYKLRYPKAGDRYQVSVWRYRKTGEGGSLRVTSDVKNFAKSTNLVKQNKNGWERLEIVFNVPFDKKLDYLLFFVTTDDINTVYFDDLSIQKIKTADVDPRAFNPRPLDLRLTEAATQQLDIKREEALHNGLLESSENDWVVGQLKEGETQTDVNLRLKGNRIEHLKNRKSSFKVAVNKKSAWNNMTAFSLHNPSLRNHLHEWLFHQLLKKEGIITADYDFVELTLNSEYLGIYAFEEAFEQHLIEKNERPNGPIVRFSEETYWQNFKRQRQINEGGKKNSQFINDRTTSKIEPYKRKQVQNTQLLKEQNELALKLMNALKYSTKKVPEVFDIPMLAKYFALVDLMQAYRGVQWHNLRFYYNPVSSKLEPIGYDGFGSGVAQKWKNGKFIGYKSYDKSQKTEGLIDYIFQDATFLNQYTQALYKYTSRAYIGQYMVDIEQDLLKREQFLQQEFKAYNFNNRSILDRADELQAYLTPFNNSSVQAYLTSTELITKIIKVTNYHNVPLRLVGFGAEPTKMSRNLSPSLLLQTNRDDAPPSFVQIKAGREVKYAFYQLSGLDSLFVTPIEPWSPPENYTPEQELFAKPTIVSNDIFTVKNKVVRFKIGAHTVNFDIVIPKGYQVVIPAGTVLDFKNKAKFLSKSPVFLNGTQRNPIKLVSSDKSAGGFTVLKADKPSALKYVQFKDFKYLDYKGWSINSSVTFYESEVTLDHCQIENSNSRNAIYIVRSSAQITDVSIINATFNGLKMDYCKGVIESSMMTTIGGNAIDILGGTININNAMLKNIQDKAINVGNKGIVTIDATTIDDSNIGLASKDLSAITIDFIDMKNCQHGFTAFQKKPEYGGGTIIVKDYNSYNIKYLHLIETGSSLNLKGTEISGF